VTIFAYRAADRHGQSIHGVMEAPDARTVVDRLQRDAYFPITIVPQGGRRRVLGLAWPDLGVGRVSRRDLLALTQQLATLLEAGMPLDRALTIQVELAPNDRVRAIMGDILRGVRGGSSLADALAKHHPRPFSRLYVNMVRAGEKGGVLESTLRRLAEFLEESQEFRDAMVSALIYPALLVGVGTAAVIFLLTFVVPRFAVILGDLNATLPLPTLLLMRVSEALQQHGWLLGIGALAVLVAIRMVLATPAGRLRADRLLLALPIVGALVVALGVVTELLANRALARAVEGLGDGVRRGAGLAQPISDAGVFPRLAVHMVRVGEETGRLEEMLLRVAGTYEAESRKLVKRLIALAEPCVILVMGLVVGFIVVAMLLAILSVTDIPI
jgi:general secretion pathway protein F